MIKLNARKQNFNASGFVWTAWNGGGSLAVNGTGVLAWAYSSAPVDTPADPDSDFNEHTDCTFLRVAFLKSSLNSNFVLILYHSRILRPKLRTCPR